jgi:hypothetical protein
MTILITSKYIGITATVPPVFMILPLVMITNGVQIK